MTVLQDFHETGVFLGMQDDDTDLTTVNAASS